MYRHGCFDSIDCLDWWLIPYESGWLEPNLGGTLRNWMAFIADRSQAVPQPASGNAQGDSRHRFRIELHSRKAAMHREDMMKSDLLSECVLLSSGVVLVLTLLVIVLVVLSRLLFLS